MKDEFNIFSQVQLELDDFFKEKIRIGGASTDDKKGYTFSQPDTLNTIVYVGGSKFEKGEKEGKVYLNSSVFRADTASKQIDIDFSNIKFLPSELNDKNIAVLKRREFKRWAKDTGFSVDLNDMVEKFPFWGHLVARDTADGYELVPITKIRCQQDAKSLNTASYVIIEHEMFAWEAQAMPNWDLSGIEYKWDDKITVLERHARVPLNWFNKVKGIDGEGDDTKSIDTVSYIVQDKKDKKKDGGLLFIEENKRDFKEAKWKDVEGRWLGMGEIENNFNNQKARNAVFNLRLRGAVWASKNLFQSVDETTAKNLVTEVQDGDVITITDQGITPINTQTKSLADFNALDEVIEGNSDQKSFTYEVATGEQLNSGTPFRLGAILSNSVNNHFGMKREKLSLFLKDVLYEYVLPDFNKDMKKKHLLTMASGEEGYNDLFEIYRGLKITEWTHKFVMTNGRVPNEIEQERFEAGLGEDFEIDIEEGAYEIQDAIDIVITGEAVNVEAKMETLSNLYQLMLQNQDPRADSVLEKILVIQDEQLPKGQQGVAPSTPIQQISNLAQQDNEGTI